MAEWLDAKLIRLSELQNVEEKMDVLADIKIKLGALNNREAEQVSRNLNFSHLFSQLTFSDREYIEQICDILKSLFSVLEPGEIYQRYSSDVPQLITHAYPTVRSLVLHEILSIVSKPEGSKLIIADINVLTAVVDRIGDEELNVAKLAMRIIREIGNSTQGLHVLYTGEILRSIARLLVKNDVNSFRIYEVVVDIAKSSPEGFAASALSGFLNSLINTLDSNDVLIQLNALEVMTELALAPGGLEFLKNQQVLEQLAQKIEQANENPIFNLLIPGLMKFFGSVARREPNEIFSKYPVVVSSLFEVIDNGEPNVLGVALDTLGHVASSVEGKYALQALGDSMPCAMQKISVIIQDMPTELRIRALNNLVLILNVNKDELQDNRILSLTKSWFDSLCDDPLGMIVSLCRLPFADIRKASLDVLRVIASQAWGQEYIAVYPGLIEFLLNRSVESFKECTDTKFEVVKNLSEAEPGVFDVDTLNKLKEFVNHGPFYADVAIPTVAVEGAT